MTPIKLFLQSVVLPWLKSQGTWWAVALAAIATSILGGCAPLQSQSTQTGGSNDRAYQLFLDKAVMDAITGATRPGAVVVQPPVIEGS